MKHEHEFRDPIHNFISVRSDERMVIDSPPFQRLRDIHQLAMSYLVYPGATHKRFEHSLGVMELATRIFDVVTNNHNITNDAVRDIVPDLNSLAYWKTVLRIAALFHDVGHLPFSHAAEELLPDGCRHETLTVELIKSDRMREIWSKMTPSPRVEDIIKLAVGAKYAHPLQLTIWESILAEIIIGDAFGADRMDYLLRDSYHAGVTYGTYDRHRLISTLRILPKEYEGTDEPALGLESGGLESSEGLMLARHFMYKQVYFHNIRRIYDIHLNDFLKSWLTGGRFSTDIQSHLELSDSNVLADIRRDFFDTASPRHHLARRIHCREHFKRFYEASSSDRAGGKIQAGKVIAEAAAKKFGEDTIRYDYAVPKSVAPLFPVRKFNNTIDSSHKGSAVLASLPQIVIDNVYCERAIRDRVIKWLEENKNGLLNLA